MRLIALGSSFAAGPGISPQVNKDAGRSGNNYPTLLAKKLSIDVTSPSQFIDLTVSGATLLNVLSEPQTNGKTTFPPQISSLPTSEKDDEETIVTITGGGNDMFYIGSMFVHALKNTWWGRIISYFQSAEEKEYLANPPKASKEEVIDRFNKILDQVHQKLPKATIYLVEYFAMMGPDTVPGSVVGITSDEIRQYIETAETLKDIYKQAAQGRSYCHIVPIADESRNSHALGSTQPWVSGCSIWDFWNGGAFHPNLAGMKAAADRIFTVCQQENSQS